MTQRFPRVALAILRRVLADNEPLVGDIFEEFGRGRSRVWVWVQVVSAIAARVRRADDIRPLRLVEERLTPLRVLSRHAVRPIRSLDAVNLSGSSIRGIGGLGIVLVVVFSTMTEPALWLLVAAGLGAGCMLGVIRIWHVRRGRPISGELNHVFTHAR